jgi:hypothetical protein
MSVKPRYAKQMRNNSSRSIPRDPSPSEIAARLERLADVRKSVVARGKALIARPEYPDAKVIRTVADVLASKWSRG